MTVKFDIEEHADVWVKGGRYGPHETWAENFAYWQGLATGETRITDIDYHFDNKHLECPDQGMFRVEDLNEAGQAKLFAAIDAYEAEVRKLARDIVKGCANGPEFRVKVLEMLRRKWERHEQRQAEREAR